MYVEEKLTIDVLVHPIHVFIHVCHMVMIVTCPFWLGFTFVFLAFYKLEALGQLMGSSGFCSPDCGYVIML